VRASINLREVTVNSKTGDFNATSLAHVINTETVNHLVVQTWLDRAGMRLAVIFLVLMMNPFNDLLQQCANLL
jgi:ATP-dependent helicase IRC3